MMSFEMIHVASPCSLDDDGGEDQSVSTRKDGGREVNAAPDLWTRQRSSDTAVHTDRNWQPEAKGLMRKDMASG